MKKKFYRHVIRTTGLIILSFLIYPIFLKAQQFAGPSVSLLQSDEKTVPHRIRIKDWTEIVSERTANSSTYKKPDGTIVIYTSREAVNYTNAAGKLQPVSTVPEYVSGSRKGWLADQQAHPFFLSEDGVAEVKTGESEKFVFGNTLAFSKKKPGKNLSSSQVNGDTVVLKNLFPGVDKIYMFRNNGMKYSYLINNRGGLSAGDLIIEESMEIPSRFEVVKEHGEETEYGWKGFIQLQDKLSGEKLSISPLWCFDGNGKSITGSYLLEKRENNAWNIKMIIPAGWIHDPSLRFPLVIDPLITGPASLWSGGMMPSCFIPNYNVDSMLITIPGQITVTSLNVTSNYYANPFSTSVMADGNMFFSTTCNNSTIFTVQPPTGSTAGTAYLENFNLKNPLLCCIPQSCSQQTFYLRMHLNRETNGTTCNTSYIYYDPASVWPFSAYIEGNTIEGFSSQILLLDNNICSDVCDIEERIYVHYGVPPFTINHPWMAGPALNVGTPAGCNNANQITTLSLLNPYCANICDTSTSYPVPSPAVTDACGNSVASWPDVFLDVKPVPEIIPPDTISFCAGDPVIVPLASCVAGATITWQGPSENGTGTIADSSITNSGGNNLNVTYSASANLNGCYGDTVSVMTIIEPVPDVIFSLDPVTVFAGQPVSLNDDTQTPGTIVAWLWVKDDSVYSFDQNTSIIFDEPGDYEICLSVQTANGCTDTSCQAVSVIPLDILRPNVITPNNDGVNDFLIFPYLEFYNGNSLKIFNRWGSIIYEADNYSNNWKAENHPDGIYFYTLIAGEENYSGFVHVIR